MDGRLRLACACLLAGALAGAWADNAIYACIDGGGHRITSDRPITECLDREQRKLNPSGTTRRVLPPSPTALERAAQEERQRKGTEEQLRLAEQKRLDRLLVLRYPTQAAHETDRARALQGVHDVIASAQARIADLQEQRKKLEQDKASTRSPAKVPAALDRQIEDNEEQLAAQGRFIAAQEEQKRRIADRYDAELARLKQLWAQQTTSALR